VDIKQHMEHIECLQNYVNEEVPHVDLSKEEILTLALNPKPIPDKDEARS